VRRPDELLLQDSSRAAIERSAGNLVGEAEQRRWLPPTNRYLQSYPSKEWEPSERGEGGEIALYMAASVPIHCVDGWSYFGRGLQAQARGDVDAATHLGYYAELRAAMALLASEGIGIFNTVQLVVDDQIDAATLSERDPPWGTHGAIWPILYHWGKRPEAWQLLGEVITFGDLSLSDWLAATEFEGNLSSVARELLQRWGLDLSRLAEDRDARNRASYYPTMLAEREPPLPRNDFDFLQEVWELLEPQPGSPFEELDRHLLRLTLRQAAASRVEGDEDANQVLLPAVEKAVEKLGVSDQLAPLLIEFLTDAGEGCPPLLELAEGEAEPDDASHHIEVLARAMLLLRLATGSCRHMLRRAGVSAESLEWWWRELGVDRGLWAAAPDPEDLIDEWQWYKDAIDEIKQKAQGEECRQALLSELSRPLSRLAGAEIVPIWSLVA
jgi:hypothetical protein